MSKNNRSGQAAVLTDSDHHRIRKNFNSLHHRLMWDIAQFTGERWGAIIKLKISDVYNNRGEVREEITFRAVTRKASPDGIRETRQVPLHPTLYEILTQYKPSAGIWLFPGIEGKHISMQAADAAMRRAIAKAKLEGKGISTHSTRRTFITELHKKGVDIYMIQQITGHKDLKALGGYIEKDKKRVRSAIALL
jgi:integrase/recombinase XerD